MAISTNDLNILRDVTYYPLLIQFGWHFSYFFSPEMKRVIKLPAKVHYKTAYFSLGCLLLHALLGEEIFDVFYQEYLLDSEDLVIKKYLDLCPIRETKLYWLICRCLVQEPEKRSILFI